MYDNNIPCGYYDKTRLSNGQTAMIYFGEEKLNETCEYHVGFIIANKKKHINEWIQGKRDMEKMTGTCGIEGLIWGKNKLFGIEGLIWGKNKLLEFEQFVKKIDSNKNKRIVISWLDSKRKNVYVKYLKRYGYRLVIHYGCEFLIKDI